MRSGIALLFTLLLTSVQSHLHRGLTPHFKNWLKQNGYSKYNFDRPDIPNNQGAYGGKFEEDQPLKHRPVIFIHGNSDIAVGEDTTSWQTGFSKSIEYFLSQGYTRAELYTTTWGHADSTRTMETTYSKENIEYIREFIMAVLSYTEADQVDIISHSMGVALARRAVKGGEINSVGEPYFVGVGLTTAVNTFIGIAGGNWGNLKCSTIMNYKFRPACNKLNGQYPGDRKGPVGLSYFLEELNRDKLPEGDHVFALYSSYDDVYEHGGLVFDKHTGSWPTTNSEKLYKSKEYSHIGMRDLSVEEQYQLVTYNEFEKIPMLPISFGASD